MNDVPAHNVPDRDAPSETDAAELARSRPFDLVLFGATGFTGQLVAAHLTERLRQHPNVRWALAGRDLARLQAVRDGLNQETHRSGPHPPAPHPELLQADSGNPDSLAELARSTRLVITTVGPYQDYGEPLLAAAVEAGTDYLDLCGEPAWMREMIDRYGARAQDSGARVVFSCGFDSVPFDLGVVFTQREALARLGVPVTRIGGRLRSGKGAVSGGTVASLVRSIERAREDPRVRRSMGDPFALTPGFKGPRQPSGSRPRRDPFTGGWLTPFIMSGINTKNVHRTQFLLGHPSGSAFTYDEMQMTGDGISGWLRARALFAGVRALVAFLAIRGTRRLLLGSILPTPGKGPSPEAQTAGHYDLVFIGVTADGQQIRTAVGAHEDPGYLSTSRMLGEAALLLLETKALGGIWTPGALLGAPYLDRLQQHAGLYFKVEKTIP